MLNECKIFYCCLLLFMAVLFAEACLKRCPFPLPFTNKCSYISDASDWFSCQLQICSTPYHFHLLAKLRLCRAMSRHELKILKSNQMQSNVAGCIPMKKNN